ncbi:MAG: peptidoglycan editing factor PgeF [Anaerolineales bacterium]|nr:peptidoglycan editing factor PgeF [Anaerolineales bacterium]
MASPSLISATSFSHLSRAGVVHGVLTRQGGASTGAFTSLNVGRLVGDDPDAVEENHRRALDAFAREPRGLTETRQVHGEAIALVERFPAGAWERPEADGLVTDQSGVTLFMRFADCVPILLFDPQKKVIGMAHAGWRGTVSRVARNTVAAMQAQYGSRPQDILAGIGPSICAAHYSVGEEVVAQVQKAFGTEAAGLLIRQNGEVKLDLWAANRVVLEQAGVRQIEISGQCTACNVDAWFSHRAEKGRTGRFGALLGL